MNFPIVHWTEQNKHSSVGLQDICDIYLASASWCYLINRTLTTIFCNYVLKKRTSMLLYFNASLASGLVFKYFVLFLQCIYWNRGHPDFENQSDGRTETIDSNIFKSGQSNARYKTMKSQLVRSDACDYSVCKIVKSLENFMLLYFRFYISMVVNAFDWAFSTVNLQPKKFFITVFCSAPVVCECFCLYTAFGCHYREIHHAILGKTIAFTVSAAVHCRAWASFLGYHCIEITSSSKTLSALYYQSLCV